MLDPNKTTCGSGDDASEPCYCATSPPNDPDAVEQGDVQRGDGFGRSLRLARGETSLRVDTFSDKDSTTRFSQQEQLRVAAWTGHGLDASSMVGQLPRVKKLRAGSDVEKSEPVRRGRARRFLAGRGGGACSVSVFAERPLTPAGEDSHENAGCGHGHRAAAAAAAAGGAQG